MTTRSRKIVRRQEIRPGRAPGSRRRSDRCAPARRSAAARRRERRPALRRPPRRSTAAKPSAIARHAPQRAVAVEHDRGDAGPRAGRASASGSGSTRTIWSACGVSMSVSSPASTTSGPSAAASAASAAGVGRLGEDDVEADRLGAGLAQRLDQLGMQAARPRPLQADLGEGRLVDGHDDRPVGRPRRRQRWSRDSRRRAPRRAATASSAKAPARRSSTSAATKRDALLRRCRRPAPARAWKRSRSPFHHGRGAGHQNRTFNEPTKLRPQPGVSGATSNSSSKRL